METQGKVFVVTGAGNGIGREVALALLASGAKVAGLDMSGAAEASTRKVVAPKDAGAAIVRAITKDEKRILIGQDASIMWHANHLSPDLAATLIYNGMKDLLPPA